MVSALSRNLVQDVISFHSTPLNALSAIIPSIITIQYMSHQPSTAETLRTTAAEATHTVAETLDPLEEKEASGWRQQNSLRDAQGGPCEKGSYKEQLNRAAYGGPKGLRKEEGIVGKVSSYIPGVAAVQTAIYGKQGVAASEDKIEDDGTPPTRPENDVQVEEFLKEQYSSQSEKDKPKLRKS